MDLDKETIENLTNLSRIKCSKEEQAALLSDLQKILDHVEELKNVETDNVKPTNTVLADLKNVMREDIEGEVIDHETFMKDAPDRIGGYIRVPTTVSK